MKPWLRVIVIVGSLGVSGLPSAQGQAPLVIGPSAPVPPEVAIPRPTPDELAQVNGAVKAFIGANRSSVAICQFTW